MARPLNVIAKTIIGQSESSAPPSGHEKHAGNTQNGMARLDGSTLALLWTTMASWYGHKWTSQYGETPSEEWAWGLGDLGRNQVLAGLDEARKSRLARRGEGESWPPDLPEFLAMCIHAHNREIAGRLAEAEDSKYRRWEREKASPETVEREMAKIRQILGR